MITLKVYAGAPVMDIVGEKTIFDDSLKRWLTELAEMYGEIEVAIEVE